MGARYLIDTNIINKFVDNRLQGEGEIFVANILDENSIISFITRIELLIFEPTNLLEKTAIHDLIDISLVLPMTEEILLKTVEIRRKTKIKLPDSIIAATALIHDLTLLSDNDKDFLRVPDLKYLNPMKF